MTSLLGDPEWIALLGVPLAMLALGIWGLRRRRRLLERLVSTRLVPAMVRGRLPGRRRRKLLLRVLAAALVAVAVARPQWGRDDVEISRRGIDLVFVVDVSRSMLAEDVLPSRIERVKADVRYFVREVVEEDRVALVAFAGGARTLCPLTLDRGAFELFLDELDVGSVSRGGTDLDAALASALAAFGDDRRNHKAIVLFSDGEGHGAPPDEILAEARRRGVRIYTVGIGSPEGVRIPLRDADGSVSYVKDAEGNVVLSRLDDKQLKAIAQQSLDGAYTNLAAGRDNLERIYVDNIRKIEERELRSSRSVRRIDRFPWFLIAALGLLALDAFLPEGRALGRESHA